MSTLTRKAILPLINAALREDAARRDLTSQRVTPPGLRVRARIIGKSRGILAGGPAAAWVFKTVDPTLRCRLIRREGARLGSGQTALRVEGAARSIFAAERTALNFLGHLCGIATLTRRYVERIRGTRARIFDTRKTLPSLRALEKYAVRIGGGVNHRSDLSEAILIKTNHLKALRARSSPQSIVDSPQLIQIIHRTIERAKRVRPKKFVEIEVANLREFEIALEAKPDAILMDNWSLASIRKAVAIRNYGLRSMDYRLILEVSGGVTLKNVRAIAKTGVDRISIGRLTHSAPSLDVALEVVG